MIDFIEFTIAGASLTITATTILGGQEKCPSNPLAPGILLIKST